MHLETTVVFHMWLSHHYFLYLSHELGVVEHVGDLRIAFHQRLHLRISHNHLPHQVRVGHHVLHQRVLHDLRKHLWVGHELPLHLLLQLHEVRWAHAQSSQTRQVTKASWRRWNELVTIKDVNILALNWQIAWMQYTWNASGLTQ